jgi:hypothetical protein
MPEQFTLLDTDTLITARSSGFGHVPNGSLADLVAIRYQIERGARYLGRDVDILVGSTSVVGACEWLAGAHSGFPSLSASPNWEPAPPIDPSLNKVINAFWPNRIFGIQHEVGECLRMAVPSCRAVDERHVPLLRIRAQSRNPYVRRRDRVHCIQSR